MANLTTCSRCSKLYEAGSEEQANEPDRLCRSCGLSLVDIEAERIDPGHLERLRREQPRAWLTAQIEHALTLMPSDAGAQWLAGWLLSQADMPQARADQIMARCATSRHPDQEPAISLCERCWHKATMHTVDGEERRECMEWQCSCEQYEHPIDEAPR